MTEEMRKLILEIKSDLYNSELFKEYFSVCNEIQNNDEIQEIIKNRRFFQQIDIQNRLKDKYIHEEYNRYLSLYNNHPLIQNYNFLKEQVDECIATLKEKLSL